MHIIARCGHGSFKVCIPKCNFSSSYVNKNSDCSVALKIFNKYHACMVFKIITAFLTLTELFPHEARTFAFADEPDSDFFCPVCRDLLTDPFQPDCGHHLCRKCRDYLLSTKKSECPTCRESDALSDARPDKYFLRKVNNVTVRCQYYDEGCEWVGEVRYLQDHLDRCAIACPFDCGNFSRRVKMKDHKNFHCLNRPIKCENCDYYNTFAIYSVFASGL